MKSLRGMAGMGVEVVGCELRKSLVIQFRKRECEIVNLGVVIRKERVCTMV